MLLKEEAKCFEWAGAIYSTVRSLLKPTHTLGTVSSFVWGKVNVTHYLNEINQFHGVAFSPTKVFFT